MQRKRTDSYVPYSPQKETIKAAKQMTLDLAPYSFTMLQFSL